jgi:hypothetical protein
LDEGSPFTEDASEEPMEAAPAEEAAPSDAPDPALEDDNPFE